MKKFLKGLFKFIGILILVIVIIAVLFFGYLTIREYKPEDVEKLEIAESTDGTERVLKAGEKLSILTWNVGYCGLDKDRDFVMDGGGSAPTPKAEDVEANIRAVQAEIVQERADLLILQEVDRKSMRSFFADQRPAFSYKFSTFAENYSCDFVPFPWPPIGTVHSGVFTTTNFKIDRSERVALPCPFSWPLRIANLKRCLDVSYLPIDGSDKQLVLVNFHLEAYDSGEGKIAQTKQLLSFMESEYQKGNYVIAGGDWNQTFPGSLEKYPNTHEDLWAVGVIEKETMPEGWSLAYDDERPTCRLLNQPYDPSDKAGTQYYVIDGFLVSPNVEVSGVKTVDLDFANSDHNPVRMEFTLK